MFAKSRKRPLIKISVALVLGMIIGGFFDFPMWIILSAAIISAFIAFISQDYLIKSTYSTLLVVLTGVFLADLHRPQDDIPVDQRLYLCLSIDKLSAGDGRWVKAQARVNHYSLADSTSLVWHNSHQSVNLYVDTTININIGENLIVRAYVNPIVSTSSSYVRLMAARGLSNNVYLGSDYNLIARDENQARSLATLSARINAYALLRLDSLDLDSDCLSLAKAMTTGSKTQMDRTLRQSYSDTGTAHLLAVSGLHTGFVFLILSLVFWWCPLFKKGHIYKTIFIVLGLWLFAAMALMSASVVRAALMLSIAQLSLTFSRRVDSYNILFGAATVMLALNPMWIYDISFQLSFMAVFSILFFLPRILRSLNFRNRLVRYVATIFTVGLAAQIGIVPLLIANFGSLPIVGLIITPLVLVPAFVVMSMSLVWIVLPLSFMGGLCSLIINLASGLQNRIVEHAALWPWAKISLSLDGGGVAIYYALMLLSMLLIKYYEYKKSLKRLI